MNPADWVAPVRAAIDDDADAMAAALAELVRIPSVTGSDAEHEAQRLMADALAADGLEVDHWSLPLDELATDPGFPGTEVDRSEAWDVVGRLPGRGEGPTLMLNGHIDVVPPGDPDTWSDGEPFSGRVDGDLLGGRGSADMKAGLIAARWAVRALRRAEFPLRGDVLVASVASEEDGGLGTFGLLHRGWRADAAIVPEPTDLALVPACAGALTFRLRVRGKAAHASRRSEGVSAIDCYVPIHRALAELERERNERADPLLDRWEIAYPLSVGIVSAGDWASSVPDVLVADGRLGVALDEPVEAARAALEAAVGDACAQHPWLRDHPVEVEWWGGEFASCRLPAGSDLDTVVARAHDVATGGSPVDTWAAPFGSDLRLLGAAGIAAVHYGPGRIDLAHAADERVSLADVRTAATVLALAAIDMCGTV